MKTLAIDDRWSVNYDPDSGNKMTGFVFHGHEYRLDQVVGADSIVEAMFTVLLGRSGLHTKSPEAVAQMVAQYTSASRLAEEAYAKGFRNGTATLAAENATLRASEAAALERIAELEAAACSYQSALLKHGIDGSKGPKEWHTQ